MIFSKLSTYKIEIFCVYKFILFYENVYINIYKKQLIVAVVIVMRIILHLYMKYKHLLLQINLIGQKFIKHY